MVSLDPLRQLGQRGERLLPFQATSGYTIDKLRALPEMSQSSTGSF
jgi:hypothetical protein